MCTDKIIADITALPTGEKLAIKDANSFAKTIQTIIDWIDPDSRKILCGDLKPGHIINLLRDIEIDAVRLVQQDPVTTAAETLREAFEIWAKDNRLSITRNANKPDEYAFAAQKAWLVWQLFSKKNRDIMQPFLKNRADGVDGRYVIARVKDDLGTHEFWNKGNIWGSAGEIVLDLTNKALSQPPAPKPVMSREELVELLEKECANISLWATPKRIADIIITALSEAGVLNVRVK